MNSSVQDKLEKEKQALATQMQSGSKELEEKMARDEELRRQEAEALKVIGHTQCAEMILNKIEKTFNKTFTGLKSFLQRFQICFSQNPSCKGTESTS